MTGGLLCATVVAAVVGLLVGRVLGRVGDRVVQPATTVPSGPPSATGPLRLGPACALVLGVVVLRVGWAPDLPAWLWFAGCAVLLAGIDLQHLLLPNRVLLPATVGAVLLLGGAAAATGAWADLGRGLLAAGVVAGGLFLLALANPAGLGLGDVKLGVLLGLYLGWVGWPAVLVGVLVGAVAQALVGLVLLGLRRARRDTHLPYGPALLGGVLAVLVLTGG